VCLSVVTMLPALTIGRNTILKVNFGNPVGRLPILGEGFGGGR